MRLKEFENAEESFAEASKLSDIPSLAYNNLAWIYYIQGKLKEAEQTAKKSESIETELLKSGSKDYDPVTLQYALCNLGLVSFERDKFPEAEKYFEQAVRLESNYAYSQTSAEAFLAVTLFKISQEKNGYKRKNLQDKAKGIYMKVVRKNKNYLVYNWVSDIHQLSNKFSLTFSHLIRNAGLKLILPR